MSTRFCKLLLGVAVAGFSLQAAAASVERIAVARDGPAYAIDAEFTIELPREQVFRAFTAFDDLNAINPAVLSSHSRPDADGRLRLTTRVRDCIAFFCRSARLVELVDVDPPRSVHAQIVPGAGDFSGGESVWQFDAIGESTRVRYHSEMRPDFWLPPVLGTRALRRALLRHIRAVALTLERAAGEESEPEAG